MKQEVIYACAWPWSRLQLGGNCGSPDMAGRHTGSSSQQINEDESALTANITMEKETKYKKHVVN
jgi:hypothetical protein